MGAKMKLLFEGWRKYINEQTDEAAQAKKEMQDRIGTSQAARGFESSPTGTPWPKEEAGNPDSDVDNDPEPEAIAKSLERSTIEKTIEDFSFNSAQSSQHRWGRGQPIIDYRFDDNNGIWTYTAYFPDGSDNVANWRPIESDGEVLEVFLTRVKEFPRQQELPLPEPESDEPPFRGPDPETHRKLRRGTREQGGYGRRGWKPRE